MREWVYRGICLVPPKCQNASAARGPRLDLGWGMMRGGHSEVAGSKCLWGPRIPPAPLPAGGQGVITEALQFGGRGT